MKKREVTSNKVVRASDWNTDYSSYVRRWLVTAWWTMKHVRLFDALLFLPRLLLRGVVWIARYLWGASLRDLLLLLPRLVWALLGRTLRVSRISTALLGALAGAALYGLIVLSPLRPIVRDAVTTVIADKLAGSAMPLVVCDAFFAEGREDCQVTYSHGLPMNYWGVVTNSAYLVERAVNIVGLFEVDRIVGIAEIPEVIYARPVISSSSVHLGGQTDCNSWVMANERYFTFDAWNDARDVQTTLTHELIHNQDGYFCDTPVPPPSDCKIVEVYGQTYYRCQSPRALEAMKLWLQDRSVWVESHTSAATVEALAAQCRVGDPVACRAFWDDVKGTSARSLYVELNQARLGFLYEPFMNALVRSRDEAKAADHAYRDYALSGPGGLAAREAIIAKYYHMPWVTYIVPGIVDNARLNTGNVGLFSGNFDAYRVILGMPYDDTQRMFTPVGVAFLRLMTAGAWRGPVDTGGLPQPQVVVVNGQQLLPTRWNVNYHGLAQ